MIGRIELERDLVIVACAISAGIHAALVPGHWAEGAAAGAAFAASAAVLAVLAVALTRGTGIPVLAGAALVLTGLIVSYALGATTGVPVLHPAPEPVEALALFTKAVEAAGLLAAAHLLAQPVPRLKGAVA